MAARSSDAADARPGLANGAMESKRRVVATGLRLRGEVLARVKATAAYQSFNLPPLVGVHKPMAARRAAGQQTERGMIAVRFATDEASLRMDAQCLLWPGWFSIPWIPAASFQSESPSSRAWDARSPHDVAGLYYEEFGGGDRIFRRERSVTPLWSVVPKTARAFNVTRSILERWLGVSAGSSGATLASLLTDPAVRTLSAKKERLAGEECVVVVAARLLGTESLQWLRLWVAPGRGYAPVRLEDRGTAARAPSTSWIHVWVWQDFTKTGDAWVARQHESRWYRYDATPLAGGKVALWGTERVSFLELGVGGRVSFDMRTDPGPIGAAVGSPGGTLPRAEMDALGKMTDELHRRRRAFEREPLPKVEREAEGLIPQGGFDEQKKELGL